MIKLDIKNYPQNQVQEMGYMSQKYITITVLKIFWFNLIMLTVFFIQATGWFYRLDFNLCQLALDLKHIEDAPRPLYPFLGLTVEENRFLELINMERSHKGLPPLILNPDLARLARGKSLDMVNNNYFDHESPVYGKLEDMLKSAGINYRLAAENIGRGNSVVTVHAVMMDSNSHRQAILGRSYRQVGIGVVHIRNGGIIVTEIFLDP